MALNLKYWRGARTTEVKDIECVTCQYLNIPHTSPHASR